MTALLWFNNFTRSRFGLWWVTVMIGYLLYWLELTQGRFVWYAAWYGGGMLFMHWLFNRDVAQR